ncbi:MMPL family transporter [Streptomyces cavernicola]|uniref:MMPL family transporter n=1 Tax=Streptomyces cavernicola TaxID=3043613 RepID=A0ABT6S7Z9_9ACTN|nr:MMPL family transporter [Streptomyces sp. B-S-A6]MDI3404145.1 MMPL family transporter [Streptomyces sp. B-S-A6]
MFVRLASLAMRRRRLVFVIAVLGFAIAAAIASPAMKVLSAGGFEDPKAESSIAEEVLRERFDTGEPNFILVARAPGQVDSGEAEAAGRDLTRELTDQDGVAEVSSYWTGGPAADELRSEDGRSALILARLSGDDDEALKTAKRLAPRVTGEQGVLSVKSGGRAEFNRQGSERITTDLARAEGIAIPITILLLVLVFGSGMAALMPLAVAGFSVVGSLAVLRLLNEVTDVSIFAANLSTALGLGLAIDYSLFIISRYREELKKGAETATALRATLRTAGRTVVFSAVTVLLSLAALLVFPLYFLRSFAYAGIGVVLFATLGALVLLPALLAALGGRIDKFDLMAKLRRGPKKEKRPEEGFWHRLATAVMRRPLPVLAVVLVVLAIVVMPFTKASFGLPDDRALPKDLAAAQVGDAVRTEFSTPTGRDLKVVLPDARPSDSELTDYATALSDVADVERVDTATGSFRDGKQIAPPAAGAEKTFTEADGAWLALTTDVEGYSEAGKDLVGEVRDAQPPAGTAALVAGTAATYADTLDSLWSALPWAVLIIAMLTFTLLFLFTGSVIMPLKTIVLNLLSLTATYGAMVYVFQDGNLQWLTGDFTVTGYVDVTMPILMFCVIFGLSMDYEVFLLSRIKEEFDRTGDNEAAVARGLESTGRLITAAAALLAIFFVALVSAGVTHVKMLGLGTALAILMDAIVIRGLLVPAFMRLAGRANWWAPGPLRRLHDKIGFSHGPSADEERDTASSGELGGAPAVSESRERVTQ